MPVLALQGVRGGTGATSITAALAWALQQLGETAIAMDWSPANQLRLHFNTPQRETRGWVRAALDGEAASQAALRYPDGPDFIPFGQLSGEERRRFYSDPAPFVTPWLQHLAALRSQYRWVLLDLPGDEQPWLQPVYAQVDRLIQLLTADGNCHMRLHQSGAAVPPLYLLNLFNANSKVQQDLHQLWIGTLRNLIPLLIHRDEALSEALLNKQPVGEYRPHALASEEIVTLANWLIMHTGGEAA
ncbi:cellulose biosynthesis protein BcsQ [Mixta tenebrionis]|uniref:Cellulose synthase operon protein YhjQ n=1 Tax=Mixta tenebrionis TaxID=2562439 RepID=A0A506V7N8_9GAMM|nr:cellulose biosynthesis protein BcsQ [Mixta tenebrionis]TPW41924.1 cellulose synthase operon protein YhjQ [Mixta tenebrionis]